MLCHNDAAGGLGLWFGPIRESLGSFPLRYSFNRFSKNMRRRRREGTVFFLSGIAVLRRSPFAALTWARLIDNSLWCFRSREAVVADLNSSIRDAKYVIGGAG